MFIFAGKQATQILTVRYASPSLGSGSDLSLCCSGLAVLVCRVSIVCVQKSQISVQLPTPLQPSLGRSPAFLAQALRWYFFTELRDPFLSLCHLWGSLQTVWPAGVVLILPARKNWPDILSTRAAILAHHLATGVILGKEEQNEKLPRKSLFQLLSLLRNLPAFESPQVNEIDLYPYVRVCICVLCIKFKVFPL